MDPCSDLSSGPSFARQLNGNIIVAGFDALAAGGQITYLAPFCAMYDLIAAATGAADAFVKHSSSDIACNSYRCGSCVHVGDFVSPADYDAAFVECVQTIEIVGLFFHVGIIEWLRCKVHFELVNFVSCARCDSNFAGSFECVSHFFCQRSGFWTL